MALEKLKTLQNGLEAKYWVLSEIKINYLEQNTVASVILNLWKDRATREAEGTVSTGEKVLFNIDIAGSVLTNVSGDYLDIVIASLYERIKATAQAEHTKKLAGESYNESQEWFFDAVDILEV